MIGQYSENDRIWVETGDVAVPIGKRRFPTWQISSRPASPEDGEFGLNTETDAIEVYDDADSEWKTYKQNSDSDHGELQGLSDDDHSQYLLLAGRGGQTITDDVTVDGNLKLDATTDKLYLGDTAYVDGTNNRLNMATGGQVPVGQSFYVYGTHRANGFSAVSDADMTISNPYATRKINLFTAGSSGITILDGGNVGIGTSSPGAKLEVSGSILINSGSNVSYFGTTNKVGIQGDRTAWGELSAGCLIASYYSSNLNIGPSYSGKAGNKLILPYFNQSTWYSALEFANVSSGYSNLLLMKSGGNVGIGTDSPDEKLQVVGTSMFGEDTTNFSKFESDGTLHFNGTATVWKDINVGGISLKQGATAPDPINLDTTSIQVYAFDGATLTEEVSGAFELQHDYKEGTNIVPHIHWYTTDTGAGNVKWQLEYYIKSGTSEYTGTTSVTTAATGTAWEEIRSDFPAITGTNFTIGMQIHFRLFRDPTDAADTYASDAALGTFGIHYEVDTVGSRQISTK